MTRSTVLVIGTGLIGTSVALGLRHRRDVLLHDPSPAALSGALSRGAGRVWDGRSHVDLAIICAPPQATAAVVTSLMQRGIASTYTHTSSVQSGVQLEVESAGLDCSAFVGGHPMAGREQSGPGAATSELFAGRTWVICPGQATSSGAITVLEELIGELGAHAVVLSAADHDRAVSIVSHLPQLAASALAAQLLGKDPHLTALAGPGLQDSTRIAASRPELWQDILALNAGNVAPLVRGLSVDLAGMADALDILASGDGGAAPPADRPSPGRSSEHPSSTTTTDAIVTTGTATAGTATTTATRVRALATVRDLLQRGAGGRELVPRKRGESDSAFASVAVSVPDAPGQLAALLTTAGAGGVNVEDVRVDHVPDSPHGVIELLVRPGARSTAVRVLQQAGWIVLGEDPPT